MKVSKVEYSTLENELIITDPVRNHSHEKLAFRAWGITFTRTLKNSNLKSHCRVESPIQLPWNIKWNLFPKMTSNGSIALHMHLSIAKKRETFSHLPPRQLNLKRTATLRFGAWPSGRSSRPRRRRETKFNITLQALTITNITASTVQHFLTKPDFVIRVWFVARFVCRGLCIEGKLIWKRSTPVKSISNASLVYAPGNGCTLHWRPPMKDRKRGCLWGDGVLEPLGLVDSES